MNNRAHKTLKKEHKGPAAGFIHHAGRRTDRAILQRQVIAEFRAFPVPRGLKDCARCDLDTHPGEDLEVPQALV